VTLSDTQISLAKFKERKYVEPPLIESKSFLNDMGAQQPIPEFKPKVDERVLIFS
jgi:hypothetical protein